MSLLGGSEYGFILVFLIILGLFMGVSRAGAGLLQSLNRHALDLERAIDVEGTSGKVCVPAEIRGSKLYNHTIGKRTDAFQERHSKIIESDEVIGQSGNLTYLIFKHKKLVERWERIRKLTLKHFHVPAE